MALLKNTTVTGDLRVTGEMHGALNLNNLTDADDLKAIEALTEARGVLTKTAANTWSLEANVPPSSHSHGNINNDGTLSEANQAVATNEHNQIINIDLTTADPSASSSTSTTFIDTIKQGANGKITATKKSLPVGSTSTAGILSLGSGETNAAKGNHNHDSTYLKLSGGTLTGVLNTVSNKYNDDYTTCGINMNNSDIVGLNSIYTKDAADNAGEGIHFYRDSTHVDTLWISGGDILFVPNRAIGTNTTKANSQKVGRFTANPTSGQIVITDGTTGGMKASGYTIGTSVPSGAVFTDTNFYHTTGSWTNLKYTATSNGGADDLSFTIPTGTTASTVALGNHVHGNVNNDGTLGSDAERAVVTDENKKITTISLAVNDPSASGSGITYISTISQGAQGKITATKSTVRDASASQSGVVSTGTQSFSGSKTFTGDSFSVNANTIRFWNKNASNSYVTGKPYINQINIGDNNNIYFREYHDDRLEIRGKQVLLSTQAFDIYDSTKSYSTGSIVWYNGTYYRCITATASDGEEWTASHWSSLPQDGIRTSGSFLPLVDDAYGLGSSVNKWNVLYTKLINGVAVPSITAQTTQAVYPIKINAIGQITGYGSAVTIPAAVSVKGNAEDTYRTGQVNLTPANIGALSLAGGTMVGALTLSGPPTENLHAATKQYVDGIITANDAMVFKGTLNGGSTTTYTPAANCGDTYKVAAVGLINGERVEIGDILICITDNTVAATSSNVSTVKANWAIIQNNVDGAVFKSTNSFTSGQILVADGTNGKIKTSGYTIAKSVPSDAKFTDTTYDAEKGISLSSGKFGHSNTAIAAQTTQAVYPIKIDAYGHITGYGSAQTILSLGTTSSTAAAGNHTHTTTIATSTGTNQLTLAFGTKYAITAGGTSYIFTMPANPNSDTKNTAGSTNSDSKLFLIGATSQGTNPTTYSDSQVYTTNGQLDANKMRLAEKVTLQYNLATESLDFVF